MATVLSSIRQPMKSSSSVSSVSVNKEVCGYDDFFVAGIGDKYRDAFKRIREKADEDRVILDDEPQISSEVPQHQPKRSKQETPPQQTPQPPETVEPMQEVQVLKIIKNSASRLAPTRAPSDTVPQAPLREQVTSSPISQRPSTAAPKIGVGISPNTGLQKGQPDRQASTPAEQPGQDVNNMRFLSLKTNKEISGKSTTASQPASSPVQQSMMTAPAASSQPRKPSAETKAPQAADITASFFAVAPIMYQPAGLQNRVPLALQFSNQSEEGFRCLLYYIRAHNSITIDGVEKFNTTHSHLLDTPGNASSESNTIDFFQKIHFEVGSEKEADFDELYEFDERAAWLFDPKNISQSDDVRSCCDTSVGLIPEFKVRLDPNDTEKHEPAFYQHEKVMTDMNNYLMFIEYVLRWTINALRAKRYLDIQVEDMFQVYFVLSILYSNPAYKVIKDKTEMESGPGYDIMRMIVEHVADARRRNLQGHLWELHKKESNMDFEPIPLVLAKLHYVTKGFKKLGEEDYFRYFKLRPSKETISLMGYWWS